MRSGSHKLGAPSRQPSSRQAGRTVTTVAVVASSFVLAGALSYAMLSAHRSAEHQHTMKCLAAYMAYVQVVGGPEAEGINRLRACEISPIGEEPTHLGPREHAFVVTKYEACLAAHLLIAFELDKSLAQQRQYCR
jgi:hypothetical protein